jgi:hypothetical protein
MDYKRVYREIITRRQENPLDSIYYGELHHIIPKSLGGADSRDNLVRLTAREHFICHALLAEMYEHGSSEWCKMNHAFLMMKSSSTQQQRYCNARLYNSKRKDFSEVMQKSQAGEKNSQFGTVWIHHHSENSIKKISLEELTSYESRGWKRGRVSTTAYQQRQEGKLKYFFPTGKRITKGRRDKCLQCFNIDLYSEEDQSILYKTLFTEYVKEDRSTTFLAKKYNCTDPTIRTLLIDLEIGTKARNGKWK